MENVTEIGSVKEVGDFDKISSYILLKVVTRFFYLEKNEIYNSLNTELKKIFTIKIE